MRRLDIVTGDVPCRDLWRRCVPREYLTDLWEVRECFRKFYRSGFVFLTVFEGKDPVGLLPLCDSPDGDELTYYPAEKWRGATWLEQNRVIARDDSVFLELLEGLKGLNRSCHLRYLLPRPGLSGSGLVEDEIGYLFHPADYDFEIEQYYACFSRKSIKSILKEEKAFEDRGLSFRLDDPGDFELMVEMNLSRFGKDSYFADDRFAGAFRELTGLLLSRGWLRVVTVLVEGRPAAVDIGSVYNNRYTLLAGGTRGEFRGIAKVINLFHLRRACRERFDEVDFLCGDFSWKTLFHLTPRPLYQFRHRLPAPRFQTGSLL